MGSCLRLYWVHRGKVMLWLVAMLEKGCAWGKRGCAGHEKVTSWVACGIWQGCVCMVLLSAGMLAQGDVVDDGLRAL